MKREAMKRSENNRIRHLKIWMFTKSRANFGRRCIGVAKRLPDLEKFGLASQIRRAAVSLTNNIAEGHGRYHFLEQIKFMLQARGSLEELLDDLNVCEDEDYLPRQEIESLRQEGWRVHKLINGYIRFLAQGTPESFAACSGTPADQDDDDRGSCRFCDRFNASSLQRFNE